MRIQTTDTGHLAKLRSQTGLLDSIAVSISLDFKCVASVAHRPQVCRRALTRGDSAFVHSLLVSFRLSLLCGDSKEILKSTPASFTGPSAQRCIFVHVTDAAHLEAWPGGPEGNEAHRHFVAVPESYQ